MLESFVVIVNFFGFLAFGLAQSFPVIDLNSFFNLNSFSSAIQTKSEKMHNRYFDLKFLSFFQHFSKNFESCSECSETDFEQVKTWVRRGA